VRTVEQLIWLKGLGLIEADTDSDWSEDESAYIKDHYRNACLDERVRLMVLFPMECGEVDGEV
jgi:hypothetical protein